MKVPFLGLQRCHEMMASNIADAVADVVESGVFVGGEFVENFERRFAKEVAHTRFCAGVGSGTDALQLAIEALCPLSADKTEIIVQTNTFAATAEAIVRAGYVPVFVDVRADDMQVCARDIVRAITPETAAIVVVHLFGASPIVEDIVFAASTLGIPVIEDCAQAHGSMVTVDGVPMAAGSIGAVSCFSFYPGKTLGALGDGGAVCTNDADVHERVLALRNHGSSTKYVHDVVGTTSRLDAIQARILTEKLDYLPAWNARRAEIAALYASELEGLHEVRVLETPCGESPSWHLYPIRVDAARRDDLRDHLAARGIDTGIHYPIPLHKQRAFEVYTRDIEFPRAENAAASMISPPIFPEMTDEEVKYVCDSIKAFFFVDYR